MPRAISIGSALVALVFLVLVLADATLVDRRPPSVTEVRLSATAGGDRIAEPIASINVAFSEAVQKATAEARFHLEPAVAGALTWDGATLIFTPSEPLPAATDFLVRVDPGFVDLAGNVATAGIEEWAFATAGPPRVVAVTPNDGSLGLATDATVALEFDRLMDTTTVEAAITFEPAITFEASWSGETITLSFPNGLAFGTNYQLEVGVGASETAGANLTAPFVTRFSTVSAGLTARVVPAADVAGIAVRSPIAVLFDGPIDPASIDGALAITPSLSGGLEIQTPPGAAEGSALVFTPSGPLAEHTTYSITLAPVVHRLGDPAQVAAGRTWSFTTGAATQSAQNQIAFLSERSGVRNVWFMNPDGSNPRQLTSELAPVTAFDVSLDGSRIAWASAGAVRVMQIDGSGEQPLTPADRFEYAPRFSPDGRNVLVARRDASGADLGYWLVPLPDVVGGEEAQVVIDGAPPLRSVDEGGEGIARDEGTPPWAGRAAFDPDGRHLLLATATGDVRIVDLRPEDGSAVPVVTRTGLEANAGGAWSATEHAFLIVARRPGETATALWSVPTSGSPQRHEPAVGSVAVSAEGLVALVVRGDGGIGHVATRPATGSQPATALTTGTDLADRWPAFGPEGRVVFARLRTDGPAHSAGIWLADPVTRVITPLSTDGVYPRWLP